MNTSAGFVVAPKTLVEGELRQCHRPNLWFWNNFCLGQYCAEPDDEAFESKTGIETVKDILAPNIMSTAV